MGRLVLIEFDSNEEAEDFLAAVKVQEWPRHQSWHNAKIVGVFIKPGLLCACGTGQEKQFRGAKFGLWACKVCNKPVPGTSHYLRDLNSKAKAKDRMLHISVRFKMNNGRVEVIKDAGS